MEQREQDEQGSGTAGVQQGVSGTAGAPEGPGYYDVAHLLDHGVPDPPPTDVLARTDGVCVFYAGQVNLLFGDPESGKTFVALAAVAETLRLGRRALVLDLDHNGPAATVARLLLLGAPTAALRELDRFRYVEPEDREHLLAIVADAAAWKPAVVVLDSIGELLPVFGASSNSPDDFTTVHSHVMKPLAMSGACVVCIDHLAKNTESRAQGATGTAAKRRAIGGTSIRVRVDDTFVPGKGGKALLLIHKDRHGGLRKHSPRDDHEPIAGTFTMEVDPLTAATSWKVVAPSMSDRNPDEVDVGDVAALAALDPPPHSLEDARQRLRWRKERTGHALREWRKQGSVSAVPGSHPLCREPGTAGADVPDATADDPAGRVVAHGAAQGAKGARRGDVDARFGLDAGKNLPALVNAGRLERTGAGVYRLPRTPAAGTATTRPSGSRAPTPAGTAGTADDPQEDTP